MTTLDALKHYAALTEWQTGQKVKRIQTDEGTEFTNTIWKAYFSENGIIHESTTAYSSASNGMVECHHCTIIERVRVCLHEARLPPSLWCEIVTAIVYLTDFTPGAKHPEITPYELWHNKKPDISHLRPWPYGDPITASRWHLSLSRLEFSGVAGQKIFHAILMKLRLIGDTFISL